MNSFGVVKKRKPSRGRDRYWRVPNNSKHAGGLYPWLARPPENGVFLF